MLFDRILPAEAVTGALRITLIERRQVLIEQHRGILGYTRDKVTVRLTEGYLYVVGQALEISSYTSEDLCVSGHINRLEFQP